MGNGKNNKRVVWSLIGFALSLAVPSTKIQRYVPDVVVGVYVVLVFVAVFLLYRYALPWYFAKINDRYTICLALLTLLCLIIVFFFLYPIVDSGIVAGGSDRDEQLDIGVRAFLRGEYPYHCITSDGHTLSALPGSLILAVPFVLLGNSAYQNFFWLAVFFLVMRYYFKSGRAALLLTWSILALSPVVLHEIVTGGDLLSISIWTLLFSLFTFTVIPRPDINVGVKLSSAILLGVGLSSRPNFIIMFPLIYSALIQNAGWKTAAKYAAVTCLTYALITAPFVFYDPVNFSPFHKNKLAYIYPAAGVIVPLVGGILVGVLSFLRVKNGVTSVFRRGAFVLAFFVASCVVLYSLKERRVDLETFAWYGVSFLFFGAVASWKKIIGSVVEQ